MAPRSGVSPTAGALLGLLAEQPRSGWDLVDTAGERFGNFWTIQRSQVYRELAQLENSGLVCPQPEEQRGRRPYAITPEGRTAYREWLQGTPGDESVRVPFLLTVAFMDDIPPENFQRILDDQRRRHRKRLDEYESQWESLLAEGTASTGPRRATLALGMGYERAALEWLEQLPSFLTAPSVVADEGMPDEDAT